MLVFDKHGTDIPTGFDWGIIHRYDISNKLINSTAEDKTSRVEQLKMSYAGLVDASKRLSPGDIDATVESSRACIYNLWK